MKFNMHIRTIYGTLAVCYESEQETCNIIWSKAINHLIFHFIFIELSIRFLKHGAQWNTMVSRTYWLKPKRNRLYTMLLLNIKVVMKLLSLTLSYVAYVYVYTRDYNIRRWAIVSIINVVSSMKWMCVCVFSGKRK